MLTPHKTASQEPEQIEPICLKHRMAYNLLMASGV
jgi:hypothetical protein